MRFLKIVGLIIVALVVIVLGVVLRLRNEGRSMDNTTTRQNLVIDPLRVKQEQAIAMWLTSLSPDVTRAIKEAQRVFSLNYQTPLPQPPYFSDIGCGLYILDVGFQGLSFAEQQRFAEAFSLIFDDGSRRTPQNLFTIDPLLWPSQAASVVHQHMASDIEASISPERLSERSNYLESKRYNAAPPGSIDALDCDSIPGVPQEFTS